MTPDPRKRKVTITMTAEEWDAVALFDTIEQTRMSGYAHSELRSRAGHKIGRAVGDPTERYKIAKREIEKLRADIIGNQPPIRQAIRAYVKWWQKGDFDGVSHLGGGNPVDRTRHAQPTPGLYLSMSPAGVLVFNLREVSFCGRYPYFDFTDNEAECLLALCARVATVSGSWNGADCSTMSVSFGAIR